MKRRRPNFACLDCGVDTARIDEYYIVTSQVWLSANPVKAGMLCIGCLEGRLGRNLTPEDFIDCPLNTDHAGWNRKSERLLERLGATVTGDTCVNPHARACEGEPENLSPSVRNPLVPRGEPERKFHWGLRPASGLNSHKAEEFR